MSIYSQVACVCLAALMYRVLPLHKDKCVWLEQWNLHVCIITCICVKLMHVHSERFILNVGV